MDSLISSERGALASLSDAPSLVFLLERALENLQCGHYTEGIVFLALAREQLVPNQNDLATALDTFLQRYAGYQLVQQTLLEACIHFAKADVEQKACVNDMLGMLPTLIRGSASFDPTFRSFSQTDYRFVHRAAPRELRSADAEAEDATRW